VQPEKNKINATSKGRCEQVVDVKLWGRRGRSSWLRERLENLAQIEAA
jgi:hypothetical protein